MAFSRPARGIVSFWHAERRTLCQGLVALVLSTFFVSGLTLAHLTGGLAAVLIASSFPGVVDG
jgi:hypothetical protein